jgi:hypothetical protein
MEQYKNFDAVTISKKMELCKDDINLNPEVIELEDRKIFLAVLQFLTNFHLNKNYGQIKHCVIRGNVDVKLISKLFDKIEFHVYESNILSHDDTLKNVKYFNDISLFKNEFNSFYFINIFNSNFDIFGSKTFDERNSLLNKELQSQRDFVIQNSPDFSLLTFNLPITKNINEKYNYFPGILYTQAWGVQKSYESFLVVKKSDIQNIGNWNNIEYFYSLSYIQNKERNLLKYFNPFTGRIYFGQADRQLMESFDDTLEFIIIKNYLTFFAATENQIYLFSAFLDSYFEYNLIEMRNVKRLLKLEYENNPFKISNFKDNKILLSDYINQKEEVTRKTFELKLKELADIKEVENVSAVIPKPKIVNERKLEVVKDLSSPHSPALNKLKLNIPSSQKADNVKIELDTPKMKLNIPKSDDIPKMKLNIPKVEDTPKMKLNIQKVEDTPKMKLNIPKVEDIPKMKLNIPKPDDIPKSDDIKLDSPKMKLSIPKPDEIPKMKLSIPKPDEIPKMKLSIPKIEGSIKVKLDIPKADDILKMKLDIPKVDNSPPKVKLDIPKVDNSPPKMKLDIPKPDDTPKMKLDIPKADDTPKVEKLNIPKLKLNIPRAEIQKDEQVKPKLNLGSPLKLNLGSSLNLK